MRRAAAACAVIAALPAAAALGQARAHHAPPRRTCHTRHHHRVCTVRRRHKKTTTTSTSTTAGTTTTTSTTTSTTGGGTTTTTQTTTQTTSTSSAAPALPHGTEIDERATGQPSPLYALSANAHTFAAGQLRFNVYNFDQDPHDFAVADSSGEQLTDAIQVPAGHSGTAVAVTVTLPPGSYVLFCTLPQHAADGMRTTIVVK